MELHTIQISSHQEGGGIMFWVEINECKLCGPFWVPETVKLISNAYTACLDEHLSQRVEDLSLSLRFKVVFMHDNAPSHVGMAPTSFLESQDFIGETLMTWLPCSPDLNPIEHLWTILKSGVYEGGAQFTSKNALWNKIVNITRAITSCQINNWPLR